MKRLIALFSVLMMLFSTAMAAAPTASEKILSSLMEDLSSQLNAADPRIHFLFASRDGNAVSGGIGSLGNSGGLYLTLPSGNLLIDGTRAYVTHDGQTCSTYTAALIRTIFPFITPQLSVTDAQAIESLLTLVLNDLVKVVSLQQNGNVVTVSCNLQQLLPMLHASITNMLTTHASIVDALLLKLAPNLTAAQLKSLWSELQLDRFSADVPVIFTCDTSSANPSFQLRAGAYTLAGSLDGLTFSTPAATYPLRLSDLRKAAALLAPIPQSITEKSIRYSQKRDETTVTTELYLDLQSLLAEAANGLVKSISANRDMAQQLITAWEPWIRLGNASLPIPLTPDHAILWLGQLISRLQPGVTIATATVVVDGQNTIDVTGNLFGAELRMHAAGSQRHYLITGSLTFPGRYDSTHLTFTGLSDTEGVTLTFASSHPILGARQLTICTGRRYMPLSITTDTDVFRLVVREDDEEPGLQLRIGTAELKIQELDDKLEGFLANLTLPQYYVSLVAHEDGLSLECPDFGLTVQSADEYFALDGYVADESYTFEPDHFGLMVDSSNHIITADYHPYDEDGLHARYRYGELEWMFNDVRCTLTDATPANTANQCVLVYAADGVPQMSITVTHLLNSYLIVGREAGADPAGMPLFSLTLTFGGQSQAPALPTTTQQLTPAQFLQQLSLLLGT